MKIFSLIAGMMICALSLLMTATPAMAMDGSMLSLAPLGAAFGTIGIAGGGRLVMSAAERAMGRLMRGPDGHGDGDAQTPENIAAGIKADIERLRTDLQAKAEEALGKAKHGEEMAQSAKDEIDAKLTQFNGLQASITELEQKLARRGGDDDEGDYRTAGQRFVEDERFKAFAGENRPRGRVIVDVKDITSLETDAPGSVGGLIQAARASAPPLPQRRMTIRALLAPGRTNSNLIEYDREKLYTNAAAPVGEGLAKPQSEIQYEEASAPVRTIAHWMRASVQILQDAPGLQSIIDQRLRYGLSFAEEQQLLNGSGTGQNLNGLVTQATAYAAPGGLVAGQMLDTIRMMILQVALAEYPANGIVLNPIDWAFIEMMKDTMGRYIIGNPQGSTNPTLWSLPVVPTQAITVDKALVGAFDLAAQIFDRQDATVEVSTEDQDNFIKNKVTIRAEERLALAVYRPQAIVYADLGRVT